MKRRKFLTYTFLGSAFFLFEGCTKVRAMGSLYSTLEVLAYDLVPKAKELHVNVLEYMHIVLHHSKISRPTKKYLRNGIGWLNEESLKHYNKRYEHLHVKQRKEFVQMIIEQTPWGEDFMYEIISYSFEAMLGDPVYGGNPDEAAWKWLSFEGGVPRPKKAYL